MLDEITGTPLIIASKAANPKLSLSEGNRNKSEKQRILLISLLSPKNKTRLEMPNSFTKSLAEETSGPSPTMMSFAFISF